MKNMIKDHGKIIEVLNEFLNGFTWKDTKQMPAIICYLQIISLDFKVSVAGPWVKCGDPESTVSPVLHSQLSPKPPFSMTRGNICASSYFAWNSLKWGILLWALSWDYLLDVYYPFEWSSKIMQTASALSWEPSIVEDLNLCHIYWYQCLNIHNLIIKICNLIGSFPKRKYMSLISFTFLFSSFFFFW